MSEPQISELLDGGISSHAALQGLLEGLNDLKYRQQIVPGI